MMRTLKSGLTIGMLVAALSMTAGCGDNDNNNNENGNDNGSPNPTRTATPGGVRTATPTGAATPAPTATGGGGTTNQTVTLTFTSAAQLAGFQIQTTYPTAKGSFEGSADAVNCTKTGGNGIFTKNDIDASGTLRLSLADTSAQTFPISVACVFQATSAIAASDIVTTVQEVTLPTGATGNVADLTVAVTIS